MAAMTTPAVSPSDPTLVDQGLEPLAPPAAPPARPRRRLIAALKLSAATIGTLAVLAGFMVLLFLRRGDVRAARRLATSELQLALEPDERVERTAYVSQRHWYHYFREMHGVLVATDRRLLYVGVEPPPLLPPREFEPQAFETAVYLYDTLTTIHRERVFFNAAPGAVVRGRDGAQTFGAAGPQLDSLAAVAALVQMRRNAVRLAIAREREARAAAEAAAHRPIYHTVRPREALINIANQYGTTPELLRQWNNLPDDRIRVGQVLMVKPQT
jgi:hypothetical protein